MFKQKFYSLKNILSKDAQYNIIFGERSNGKTYSVLKYGLEKFCKTGEQTAIVRRWSEDFKGKRGSTMYQALVNNNEIEKLTEGKWTDVYYYSGRWYLCKYNEKEERTVLEKPIAYAFALGSMEHDKSTSYPEINTILFDEFLTRTMYLPDEFVLFMNVLSTIIRHRKNVKIFMLGNTVNKYCPYFNEMGLRHIKDMKVGDIDIYSYGDSDLKVAVEYCKPNKQGKESDTYFAFDNPKLNMITGGAWEVNIYPHCPIKYAPKDIKFTYFIIFDGEILQCEVIMKDNNNFTFIHRKTSPIKDIEKDLIYSTEYSSLPNWKRKINRPVTDIEKKIAMYFAKDKVFYQDNDVGEIVRNYLMWCGKDVK
jgi:hypothetical protein